MDHDETAGEGGRARRTGGRAGQRRRGGGGGLRQLDWTIPQLTDAPVEPLTPEGVAAIDNAAMRILEEIGIDFLHPEARHHLKAAGAEVADGSDRVRMGREMVRELVAKAPPRFTITPRNPARAVEIGGRAQVFINVSSPPNCSDLDRGRRAGSIEDFRNLIRLSQHFNCIHMLGGYPVEPVDIHPSVRHLDCIRDKLVLGDKVVHAYSLGTERVEDAMEMVRIAGGLSHAEFEATPRMYTNINSTSPLKHDWPMLDGAMRLAARGQPVIVTPFTLAGAMAPVTLAGAIAQQTAEALAAIVLLQHIRPGCPVVMGSFTSNVDMRSGAPAFGTPEYMRATQMSGQMARFYGLPMRASNACAANCPDAQAAWESAFSLWACVTGHANVVYHAAGWLEGGLCASFEKFVMDCETLQQVIAYNQPIGVTEDDLAVDAIRAVDAMPPSQRHFFGAEHTQSRYETAFYAPFLSDWRNYETWEESGAVQTPERANRIWKQILAEFEPPAMDEGTREELDAFVARRKAEGGAPTDF
ncbi:trimethylamine methyltransferase family protein [Limibaculum sp. FT325]|uniref:trimethylamine methyltransferase family protein n=1 Tax=Thermohalobaculum sediminis TaxID=2939436 RepID=UPI0020BDA323|nr:trimethylamine methyltransferase family protein [Limibaculum sediminis]MCL5776782.1 trimethylamine methyltransferase family protein [Limibaculum sediminis]